ncbi:thioredoxin domain-containing protein [Candidatus Gottesmanbacteria bacterium]|nr:thioredoxin domain-containing protein [Candidatus Gottesmanbacteria bacterium]
MTTILIGLLIVASFVLGSLWTKVQVLEKGNAAVPSAQVGTVGKNAGTGAAVAQQPPPAQQATKKPELTSDDRIRGNKNAKIALIEYSDYECPFCKRFHPTMQQVMKEYGDKVKWVYRDFPLNFHQNAQKEAEGGRCINELGGNDAFWKYTDAIFDRTTSNGTGFALDKLGPLAAEVGVNQAKFQSCLDSGKYTKAVQDQEALGSSEGVTGTPGTIILTANGDTQLIPGALPFEQVKPMIDKALQ